MSSGFSRRQFVLSTLGFGLAVGLPGPVAMARPDSGSRPLRLTFYNDYAPYSSGEGKQVQGLLIDVLGEALGVRMGLNVTFEGFPWKRAQTLVRKGGADGFCTIPTRARREYTAISKEAVVETGMKIFTHRAHGKLGQLKDAVSLDQIGDLVFTGALGGGWQKSHIGDKGYQIKYRANIDECLKLIVNGHADVFVGDKFILRDAVKKGRFGKDIVEMPNLLEKVSYHLCLGKKSVFADRIADFDQALRQMKEDGSYRKMIDSYL